MKFLKSNQISPQLTEVHLLVFVTVLIERMKNRVKRILASSIHITSVIVSFAFVNF